MFKAHFKIKTGLIVYLILFLINADARAGTGQKESSQLTGKVYITNLEHQYDGKPKSVETWTIPQGLNVKVTYNNDSKAPANAGEYNVYAEITNARWSGSATAKMIIKPAPATISFGNIIFQYDGKQKNVSVTTNPPGLSTKVEYEPGPPVNAGSYKAYAEITDKNYVGAASTDIIIEKAPATINFDKLVELYDGSPKSAAISTVPQGLRVTVTYNNSGSLPVNPGKYNVVAIINEQNYTGQKSGTFIINSAPVSLGSRLIKTTEDAEPATLDLSEIFQDPDAGDVLTYSISNNSNAGLFSDVAINNNILRLAFKKDAFGSAELTIKATDNYAASAEAKVQVDIDPINDPPFIEIDDAIVRFVPIIDNPAPLFDWIKIDDPDDEQLMGAQILFNPRTYETHVDLLLYEGTGKIKGSFSREAGTLTLSGADTKENYEKALLNVKYDNRSDKEFTENRILTIYVDDGKSSSNFVHKEIELVDNNVSLNIPTCFTPNFDNANNTWKIQNISNFPDASIKVFNRAGQMVFNSANNLTEWDGTFNGKPVPVGSYYYIINIPSYGKVFTGYVTILR